MDASPRLIGEYLIARGDITPGQLQEALERQARSIKHGHMPLLGEILVESGALEREGLDLALAEQEARRFAPDGGQM